MLVRRTDRDPFLELFDRPDVNMGCPRRNVTTTATQAFSLLNGRMAHDAARAFADRIFREVGGGPSSQVERAFLLALGRKPDRVEHDLSSEMLKEGGKLAELCLALFNTN